MISFQEIISEYEKNQISAVELIEAICRYESWILEIDKLETGGYTPKVYEDNDKKLFLALFSTKVNFKNFTQLNKLSYDENYIIKLSGYWLFQNLPRGIDYLSIDPEEKHNINYKKEQFEILNETAKLVEIDIPILKWQSRLTSQAIDSQEVKELFLNKKYFVVKLENTFPLAPDKESRKLFPIFHTSYSANRFVIYLNQKNSNSSEILKIQSEKLFEALKDMEIDGFVFNPLGPITPRAFHKDLLKYIL